MEFIKMKGDGLYSSMWSKGYQETNEKLEVIIMVHKDSLISNIKLHEPLASMYTSALPKLVNGRFTTRGVCMRPREITKCSQDEIAKLQNEMKKRNLSYGTLYVKEKWCGEVREKKYETLKYLDKEKFNIVLNGEKITYADLKKRENLDGYVTLSGDNGYSHCWSRSTEIDKVFAFIEKLFAVKEFVRVGEIFGFNRAFNQEMEGWKFDENCALVLSTTKKEITPTSEVSFS
jgi:hypothetical protein